MDKCKLIGVLFLFLSLTINIQSQCFHTVRISDTYGDGWNGGTVKVQVNGIDVLTNLGPTLPDGNVFVSFNFLASTGSIITVIQTASGFFPSEMRVEVLNPSGTVIIAVHEPTVNGTTGVALCPPIPMSIISSTVTQSETSPVQRCAINQKIVRLEITTSGVASPITLTQIVANLSGTSSVNAVNNLDIYYSGNNAAFSTGLPIFGSTWTSTNSSYNINGNLNLLTGINYFWLVYDLNNSGLIGTTIDGYISQFTANGIVYTNASQPNILLPNPAGSRPIKICEYPGGVSNGLEMWVRADEGLINYTNGTTIAVSGNPQINFTSTSYNYNPYIDFIAPNGSIVIGSTDPIRQFIRLIGYESSNGINYRSLFFTLQLTDLSRIYSHLGVTTNVTGVGAPPGGTLHGGANGILAGIQQPGYDDNDFGSNSQLGTWKRNGNSIPFNSNHTNEKQILSATSSTTSGTVINRFLGGQRDAAGFNGATRDWKGPVSELIGYYIKLSPIERSKIHSYLAVKYGITLSENYLATNSQTLFDISGDYNTNIIGIGRDDIEGLMQKQSHQNDDKVRLYMGSLSASNSTNGSLINNDISYIMMGANSGLLCATPSSNIEKPTFLASNYIYSRIEREWKIVRTNHSQNFNLEIILDPCALTSSINSTQLCILIDNDGNFSNGGTQCFYNGDGSGVSISYSNSNITITGISTLMFPNNNTRFLTIGSFNKLTPLPIEIINYEAKVIDNKKVALNWRTASEINSDLFTIERSDNMLQWTKFVEIKAAGNSSTIKDYNTIDSNPFLGENYYRLNQYDLNGSKTYSEILSVIITESLLVSTSPNPVDNLLKIGVQNIKNGNICILDNLGKIILEQKIEPFESSILINTFNFSSGLYFLQVKSDSINETKIIQVRH